MLWCPEEAKRRKIRQREAQTAMQRRQSQSSRALEQSCLTRPALGRDSQTLGPQHARWWQETAQRGTVPPEALSRASLQPNSKLFSWRKVRVGPLVGHQSAGPLFNTGSGRSSCRMPVASFSGQKYRRRRREGQTVAACGLRSYTTLILSLLHYLNPAALSCPLCWS